ncbi:MAG: hypothetical protein HYZ04_01225 [Rhodospirillales bacterium]|nr:hypothetical protein [Rhodospirillales bacterium]
MNKPTKQKAPPGAALLQRLRTMEPKSAQGLSLILLSLSALPTGSAEDKFWNGIDELLWGYKQRYEGELYELSQADRALLIKFSEFSEIGMLSDLKVAILRLIQQYLPEHFGLVDQTRLLRNIDLRVKLSNAVKFLEHYEKQPGKTGDKGVKLRPLQESDIDMVVDVNKKVGHAQFSKIFVQHQKIAQVAPGKPPTPVMNEYFIGMDALKKHVFTNVELRASGNLFNQLTITLDRLLIEAFQEVNPERKRCSINLNVESVFTRTFETFLGDADSKALTDILFEFRQANILQHFDEFEIAANLIRSRGGTIAIDAIFAETVGLVNLSKLRAAVAKVFWRPGAESMLPKQHAEIKRMQDAGVIFVIARLDDEVGIQVGQQLGITLFQGFHVDQLLKTA